jgi:streptogramin lyase
VVNEISTVVFAYSMSGFISTSIPATVAANIGAPATSLGQAAIANAMANALNVVNIAYGQVPTTELKNSNATLPQAKIYSLANLLGECVNTTGPGKGKGNTNGCNTLFTDTNDSTNEAQAIFYIAHNSTSNVSNLFDIISTTPAFGGGLGKAPTDWTLPIIYSGAVSVFGSNGTANTQGPYSIAMDASGNAWIGDRVNGVVEITAQGTVSPSKTNFAKISFGMVKGVTVAPSGSLWIADYGSSKVYVTDTSGNLSQTISSGLDGPAFVAIDTAGDAYVVNEDNSSVSVYNSSATNLAFEVSFSGLNIDTPDLIAIDKNGNAWITSTDTNSIGKLSTSYTASKISGPAGGFLGAGALEGDYWLGFDSSSHMWIGDFANSAIDKGTLSGTSYTFPTTGSTGGGLNGPDLSAIDGAGVIWMPDHPNTASTAASVITAYNGTSSSFPASAGYTTGGTKGAVAAAVDISGDVWVANEDGTVSELLGLGTPTVAPLTPTNGGTKP